jgi:hypothetical protein
MQYLFKDFRKISVSFWTLPDISKVQSPSVENEVKSICKLPRMKQRAFAKEGDEVNF